MIQAILFDYGGVIGRLDWEETGRLEEKYSLPKGGLLSALYDIPQWHEIALGRSSEREWLTAVLARLYEMAGRPIPGIRRDWPKIWRGLNEDVVFLARRLRSRYKVGLITNATRSLDKMLAEHDGLVDLFDVVINSARVGMAKPDVRIYHLAAERLGVPVSACVFTDDLVHNIEGARAAGMHAFHFQGVAELERQLRALGVEW